MVSSIPRGFGSSIFCIRRATSLDSVANPWEQKGETTDTRVPLHDRVSRVSVQPIQPAKPPAGTFAAADGKCRLPDEPDCLCGQQCGGSSSKQPDGIQLCLAPVRILLAGVPTQRRAEWHQDPDPNLWPLRHHVAELHDTVCMGSLWQRGAQDACADAQGVTGCQRRVRLQHHGRRAVLFANKLANSVRYAADSRD